MSSGFPFQIPGPRRSAAWYFRQRQQRRDRRLGYDGFPIRVEQIADRDNLYHCYQQLLKEGGPAAGVDGVHAADLSPSEAGNIMGVLSQSVLDGSYRPSRTRQVPIPKPGSSEHRILKIGVLIDRVVGKALHNAWQMFWEQRFLDCSYGFRPQRSTWTLLADLNVAMSTMDRHVLVIADIRKAFDNVPVDAVIELHRQALKGIEQQNFKSKDKARTLTLIAKVLRGHDCMRTRGIDQGGPYSPAAMNVLLHHTLDVPVMEHVGNEPLWYRYADNLAFLANSVTEGKEMLHQLSLWLQPCGLTLKAEADVVDLSTGDEAHLLGFHLRQEGDRLHYFIGAAAWNSLKQHLSEAHSTENPPATARQVVLGWVNSLGPAFASSDAAEILSIATEYGFRELALEEVIERWKASWKRWRACLRRARHCNQKQASGVSRAAPLPPTTGLA
jgi:retron-type reverse transcriptase